MGTIHLTLIQPPSPPLLATQLRGYTLNKGRPPSSELRFETLNINKYLLQTVSSGLQFLNNLVGFIQSLGQSKHFAKTKDERQICLGF